MRRSCTFLAMMWMASASHAESLPLSRLLDTVEAAPVVRAVDAELTALDSLRQQREAEAGWQWFASAGAGRYRELVTEDVRDDYQGRDLALGLRHPLLGSLHRQLDAVKVVESERQQQQARRSLYRAQQRLALRSAYADWWRAQQESRWCEGHADSVQRSRDQLAERVRGGWLLASEARLLDGRWQALQRRCSESGQVLEETRYQLSVSSGQPVEVPLQAVPETLATTAQPLSAWLNGLEAHPRLDARREQLRLAEQSRHTPWYTGIDSSFSVAQSYEDRNDGSKPDSGLVASISLSAPFDPLAYGKARGDEREARHQAAMAQLQAERDLLVQAIGQALGAHRHAADELLEARQQRDAAALAVREQRLRLENSVDQAYAGAMSAALDQAYSELRLIAAWHGLWLRQAALQLFLDDSEVHPAMLGPVQLDWREWATNDAPVALMQPDRWRRGTYVWDSRRLLDANSRADELASLVQAGMQRIYLGLSAAQLAAPDRLKDQLQVTLSEARSQGLEVALLLGDPDWLLPARRQGLIDVLATLALLPFSALHLDLEVEQLGWPVPTARLQDWMDTLAEVAQASHWPVEISSHHRWFAAPRPGEYCVPCRLDQRGVRQISLMIYTRNPERSAELAQGIARRWPGLSFRLAQSVEPQLPAEQTWSGQSRAQLHAQEERWRQRLHAASITGIDWQDWSYYPH